MRRINEKKAFKLMVLFIMISFVTALHCLTNQEETILHVIYRELYFLPIFLAGFWFGLIGGLTAAIVVTVLYLPVVIAMSSGLTGHDLENLLAILLFNIFGILVGWLKDREVRYQTKRRKDEGLAVIGEAVACIAHDMKTPLIAIGGLVRQIHCKVTEGDKTRRKLDIVLQQTERLELMVKDMLAFARPLDLNCQNDDVNKLFQDTILLANEKAMRHDVYLSLQSQEGLSVCSFDYYRLQQALLNLINNAMEASSAKSEVVIRCKLDTNSISIEVEDSGEGVPADQIDEIVHPFFSSKKEGTGLGLPIVKKIAEAHGGILQFEQKGGKGMVFRMIFPIVVQDKRDMDEGRSCFCILR